MRQPSSRSVASCPLRRSASVRPHRRSRTIGGTTTVGPQRFQARSHVGPSELAMPADDRECHEVGRFRFAEFVAATSHGGGFVGMVKGRWKCGLVGAWWENRCLRCPRGWDRSGRIALGGRCRVDAERRRRHSHAERGNERRDWLAWMVRGAERWCAPRRWWTVGSTPSTLSQLKLGSASPSDSLTQAAEPRRSTPT
jgi:hypothetical protein